MSEQREKIQWKNQALNFLGVIVGVYAAFAITTWQISNDQAARRTQYLQALKSDLEKDISSMESDLSKLDTLAFQARGVLAFSSGRQMSRDSIDYYFTGIVVLTTFRPSNFTFQSMVSAGVLTEFDDVEFTMELTELYNGLYSNIKLYDDLGMSNLQDYVIARMVSDSGFDDKFMRSRAFASLVFVVQSINSNKRHEYLKAKSVAQKLLMEVRKKLE